MASIRRVLAGLLATVAAACADGPIGPSALPLPLPSQAADLSIASLVVTGQFAAGHYTYWPEVRVTAGAAGVTVQGISIVLIGTTSRYYSMSHQLRAGQSYTHTPELMSQTAATAMSVNVSFVDGQGRPGQVSAAAAVPPVPEGGSSALQIMAFTVSGFMERDDYAYWPKLTLRTAPDAGTVTVQRIAFDLGAPPFRTSIPIGPGLAVEVFHGVFYGEPEFYVTTAHRADRVAVTVSFVDGHGRAGDARAVAPVTR